MKVTTVKVELRPGWAMHVGVVLDASGTAVWKAPVARTNPNEALADAEEYLGDMNEVDELLSDVSDIDEQLRRLDESIRARRDRVLAAMAPEQCHCARCESGRAYVRQALAS